MSKILSFCFALLILVGCVAGTSIISGEAINPEIEHMTDEMLELASDIEQERTAAIYVVVISEPEIIIAKPPEE
jgi:hypothetical protein